MSEKNTMEEGMQFSGRNYFKFRIFWSKTKCHCRIKGTKKQKTNNIALWIWNTSLFCTKAHQWEGPLLIFCPLLTLPAFPFIFTKSIEGNISGECVAFLPGFHQDNFDFEGGTRTTCSQVHLPQIQPQAISFIFVCGDGKRVSIQRETQTGLGLLTSCCFAASLELTSVF